MVAKFELSYVEGHPISEQKSIRQYILPNSAAVVQKFDKNLSPSGIGF
jgi:hypothetical protein